MAAFSKASAAASESGSMGDMLGAETGGAGNDSGSSLAAAMGDSDGTAASNDSGGSYAQAQGGTSSAPKSGLAKAAVIAAGAVGNLAQGSWDVAKAKGASIRAAAMDRISETTGGKIATAIKGANNKSSDEPEVPGDIGSTAAEFGENHLAAGKAQSESAVAPEVAEFVNKTS